MIRQNIYVSLKNSATYFNRLHISKLVGTFLMLYAFIHELPAWVNVLHSIGM